MYSHNSLRSVYLFFLLTIPCCIIHGFVISHYETRGTFIRHSKSQWQQQQQQQQRYVPWLYDTNDPNNSGNEMKERNFLDLIFNPYESKIPKEIEKEIYDAEGSTQAAKDRTQRIMIYAVLAFVGVVCAFFNGFLTEVRNNPLPDGTTPSSDVLETIGFGWVYSNILFSFLFTNKIGGLICLLGGGACGLLAEAEYDTRRINAEKIYDELQRRRTTTNDGTVVGTKKKQRNNTSNTINTGKKRRSGKESKRMNALSEVTFDLEQSTSFDTIPTQSASNNNNSEDKSDHDTESTSNDVFVNDNKRGSGIPIIDKMKEFYNQADAMAATQALLLNKKLEDEGLIPKITDESGLKIIGRKEAAKLNITNNTNSTINDDNNDDEKK